MACKQQRPLCTASHPPRILDNITERFRNECWLRDLAVTPEFARFLVQLLARDSREGLLLPRNEQPRPLNDCACERFIARLLRRYENRCDTTVCSARLTHLFMSPEGRDSLSLKAVKAKYSANFQIQLKRLIDDILQYPETSSREQLDQMCVKMQVFIVANYSLGCPKNHVLMTRTSQGLHSVIGRGDLQNYVLKKRYHRLEYLQRLGATVCGILVHNNHGPNGGEKEHMREILADLAMAQTHTKEAFEDAVQRMTALKRDGQEVLVQCYEIDADKEIASFYCPVGQVNEIGQYLTLFAIYERQLRRLLAAYERTAHLVNVARNKMNCVVDKINEVLTFRTAIESELIFPHFVYLSEVWTDLVLYLNHLAELNRTKDEMDGHVTPQTEALFQTLLRTVRTQCAERRGSIGPIMEPFGALIERTRAFPIPDELKNAMPENIKDYCALGFALLQGGAFLPACLHKKLYEHIDVKFGFQNIENAKYAEKLLLEFLCIAATALWTNVDAVLHFELSEQWLQHEFHYPTTANYMAVPEKAVTASRDIDTQTEMTVINVMRSSNDINVMWNSWDFHKETIRLANLRRRQTHGAQTALTYGRRDAQQQAYNTRRHF